MTRVPPHTRLRSKVVLRQIVAAGIAALIVSVSGCATTAADCDEEPYASVVDQTNRRRTEHGVRELTCDEELSDAAQRHADQMCRRGFVSHRGADGSMPDDRIDAEIDDWTAVGENVAAGQRSAAQVVDHWMASPRHRENILRPTFTRIGVGYTDCENMDRWVQTFADSGGDH